MTRRFYPRPPIVEAVIDLRFVNDVSGEALLDTLSSRLASRYSGRPEQQEQVELSASVAPDAISTTARRLPFLTFLRSSDGLRLIGCSAQMLSVHTLAPYPGWESFLEQTEEAIAALPDTVRAGGLTALTVRYIDRITLPRDACYFTDYLTIMPPRPDPMPSTLSAFHFVTQMHDAADDTTALLTLASGPPTSAGEPVLIYDLSLQRSGAPLCRLGDESWRPIVEALHERQREVFEASITDRMRELFQ